MPTSENPVFNTAPFPLFDFTCTDPHRSLVQNGLPQCCKFNKYGQTQRCDPAEYNLVGQCPTDFHKIPLTSSSQREMILAIKDPPFFNSQCTQTIMSTDN